jgi:CheY-like chemotaxis protein
VLVVDDEPAVCRTVVLFLTKAGFTCTSADSGEAALALLQDDLACDLLITDQSMPGMSGVELIGRVAELRPTLPALLVTAYDLMSHLGRVQGRLTVLRKPFDRAPLIRQVETLIAASRQDSVPTPEAAREAAGPPGRDRIERSGD